MLDHFCGLSRASPVPPACHHRGDARRLVQVSSPSIVRHIAWLVNALIIHTGDTICLLLLIRTHREGCVDEASHIAAIMAVPWQGLLATTPTDSFR